MPRSDGALGVPRRVVNGGMGFKPAQTLRGETCRQCIKLGTLCYQHRTQKPQKPQLKKRQPKKFTEAKRRRYLELLAGGVRRGAAAKAVGLERSAPLRNMRTEPDFAAAVEEAEMQADSEVQRALFLAATEDRNVTAIQVWFYNRLPEAWVNSQRREVHHKISDGERALLLQAASAAGLTGDQIEAMARVLEVGTDDADDDTLH